MKADTHDTEALLGRLVSGRYVFFVPPSSLAMSYLSKSVDVGPNCVSSADQVQGTSSPGYHRQTN